MIANLDNMRQHYAEGVLAVSLYTDEEASANPHDYFWLPEGEWLIDSNGDAMVLAHRRTETIEIT
jgi:hypothetical protein